MADGSKIEALKTLLRQEVAAFCRLDDTPRWKKGISSTLQEIRANNWPAVFFGGTLRSLLLSRLVVGTAWKPRDLDIVVWGVGLSELERQFNRFISRKTRFGGLHLKRFSWEFDLWPLERTYALLNECNAQHDFWHLPTSTFLNLEAVAMDIWPQPGHLREIYSAEDQFFTGIITRTLELNREENPFPELSVVRALVLAGDLQLKTVNLPWKIGPRLLRYIARYGADLSDADLLDIQVKHYGKVQWHQATLRRVLDYIDRHLDTLPDEPVELPLQRQLVLWGDEVREENWGHIRVSTIKSSDSNRRQFDSKIAPSEKDSVRNR